MKTIYLSLMILLFSCGAKKEFVKVKYDGYSNFLKKNYTYQMNLKKGFEIREIHGGNEWKQKEFVYPDNSVLYISDEDGNTSLNYDNIRNDKVKSEKSTIAFYNKDTITLQGIDKNGKFWKNKYDGIVNIGYLNVPIEKKKEFDDALISLTKKY